MLHGSIACFWGKRSYKNKVDPSKFIFRCWLWWEQYLRKLFRIGQNINMTPTHKFHPIRHLSVESVKNIFLLIFYSKMIFLLQSHASVFIEQFRVKKYILKYSTLVKAPKIESSKWFFFFLKAPLSFIFRADTRAPLQT